MLELIFIVVASIAGYCIDGIWAGFRACMLACMLTAFWILGEGKDR